MDKRTNELITTWRAIGPVAWAQGAYGWGGEDGRPVTLTPWQAAVLSAWWSQRDCSTLAISNVKKTGKTFTNAVLTAWRWLALPGQHFTAGNDLDQAASRVFSEIAGMVKRNGYLSQVVKIGQRELVFTPTGSTLTALAADASGNAGANHLTASHTEAWGIIYEQGIRAYEELTPPPGSFYGFPALRICDSYAGFEGESKTWHELVDRGLKGERVSDEWPIYREGGLLLFHVEGMEAQARCFRGNEAEAEAYYQEQRRTLRPNAFTRFHENRRTSGESAFLPEGAWEGCYSPELRPLSVQHTARLVFGADASTSRDLTALVGCGFDEQNNAVMVRYVKVWKPVKIAGIRFGKPTVDLAETIGAEVMRLYQEGQLSEVVCDPYQLHSLMIEWQKAGIKVTELPQTAGRTESDQALYDAVISRAIRHYNDPVLNEHIRQAVAVEGPRGVRLVKEKTSLKIDAAVALSMAHYGALASKRYAAPGVMANPFATWPPPDGAAFHPVHGWVEYWNFTPHPPGVTWQNCKHRNKGCTACERELEESGFYAEQARADRLALEDARNREVERAQSESDWKARIDQRAERDAQVVKKFNLGIRLRKARQQ